MNYNSDAKFSVKIKNDKTALNRKSKLIYKEKHETFRNFSAKWW